MQYSICNGIATISEYTFLNKTKSLLRVVKYWKYSGKVLILQEQPDQNKKIKNTYSVLFRLFHNLSIN